MRISVDDEHYVCRQIPQRVSIGLPVRNGERYLAERLIRCWRRRSPISSDRL